MTHHPQTHATLGAPLRLPSPVPGILLMIAGVLGLGLALAIAAIPLFLFLIGGGGNVDAFEDFASGFYTVGLIVGFVSLAMLVLGIVLTVVVARKRKRLRSAAWAVRPPAGPQPWQSFGGPRAPRR